MSRRKTWQEKFNTAKAPYIKTLDKDFADIKSGETILISSPADMAETIAQLKPGEFIDARELRKIMARKHGADKTCPVCNGIFLRILTEAAFEEHMTGKPLEAITPFWRVMDKDSPTAKKISFDPDFITLQRERELS